MKAMVCLCFHHGSKKNLTLTQNTMPPDHTKIIIYTDGSCDPFQQIGGWAAIILYKGEKIILQGKASATSHQRMELEAVIRAIQYLETNNILSNSVTIYSDSQYVVGIAVRKEKLKRSEFRTKSNSFIPNVDLIATLIRYLDSCPIEFIKVKAHQKMEGENLNRTVDKLARKIVRQHIGT